MSTFHSFVTRRPFACITITIALGALIATAGAETKTQVPEVHPAQASKVNGKPAPAKRKDATVQFVIGAPSVDGAAVRLPMPEARPSRTQVGRIRGEADSAALLLRHHDPVLHRAQASAPQLCGSSSGSI